MIEFLDTFNKVNFGTVSGWTLVALVIIAWWKGLPSIIEAIANRQSKIEERLGAEMSAMSERWNKRLAEADAQHARCMEGQEHLLLRIKRQDLTIANQNKTIAKQTDTIMDLSNKINALRASNAQQQIAAVERIAHSPQMDRAIAALKEVK